MNANQRAGKAVGIVGAAGAALLALSLTAYAQVQTEKSVTSGEPTQSVTVERGEVAWVSGNNLMVKAENGELKFFPNIPDSARVNVGGKQLGVADLKPGMQLERTTITTTTPKTIRTVRSVTGTVWQVTPPNSVILTLDNRTNQRFDIPRDQKFMVDGRETDAFGLRPGMRITASAVSEQVDKVVTTTQTTRGTAPPAPPVAAAPPTPPPPQVAVLIVAAPPEPAPAPVATTGALPQELPKTGSIAPLLGLIGLLSIGAAGAIRMLRS
jgi:LPXTG-motif cell wall-anchored protein